MKNIQYFKQFNESSKFEQWDIISEKLENLFQNIFIDENENAIDIKYYQKHRIKISTEKPNERTCIKINNKAFMYPIEKIGIVSIPCPDHYNWPVTLHDTIEWKKFFQEAKEICESNGFYLDFCYEIYGKIDDYCVLYDYYNDEDRGDPRFLCFYPYDIRKDVSSGLVIKKL